MKKHLLIILTAFLLSSCFHNKTKEFEVGNLWKVTSRSGVESFIYGTVHLYPKSELELSEKVISKLEKSKVLALERDITDITEQERFSNFQLPEYFIESYKVLTAEYGDELVSMEGQFIKIANENGIEISGLESTEEILEIMTDIGKIKFPQSEFQKDKMIQVYKQTLDLYKKEQILTFKDSMVSQMPIEMVELSVNNRNKNWVEDIINLVEQEPTFIAVGMGHLGGKNGLLKLLNDKKYKLERIE